MVSSNFIDKFPQVLTTDPVLYEMQENIARVLDQITTLEILSGRLLTDVTVNTGAVVRVEHGLDRPVNGWIIVKKNASSILWDSEDTNTEKKSWLELNSSANVTVDIWVF